ncbi:MAG TPA: nucleotide exchange factor GrpE [Longimicrobiaceae bacterium]|nr:nucleotide exchange factor GrpE [Longimicrobiaceae bacterium]
MNSKHTGRTSRSEESEQQSAESWAEEAQGGDDATADLPSAAIQEELEGEREQLDRAAAEIQALRDRHLRLAAEFDNYRKRTDRERTESWTRAQAQLVEQLLDPLDDLDRVAQLDASSSREEALLEGVQLVRRKLLRALEAAGLETVEAADQPFDPERHEALMMVPTDVRDEDDTVADVFQKGYSFKGILLRPARVQVRKHS